MKRFRAPGRFLVMLLLAVFLTSFPASAEVKYCPPGTLTPEWGFWMPEQDGRDLLALNQGLEAWAKVLKHALEDERSRADKLMERMDEFMAATETEREEWKIVAKKEYERGYADGFRRGRQGIGFYVGLNYDGEPAGGIGYVYRF